MVTTPQLASAEVAERAGSLAAQLHQHVVGVIENMAWMPCPHCGERIEVFGAGKGPYATLLRANYPVMPLKPEQGTQLDKIARAWPAVAAYEAHDIYHPIDAPWLVF